MDSFLNFITIFIFLLIPFVGLTQILDSIPVFDHTIAKDFEIGGIKITGAKTSDKQAILAIAGLKIGNQIRIPSSEISRAMKSLLALRLFNDVQILKEKTIGDIVFLEIIVEERAQLAGHTFKGIKKANHDDLNTIVKTHLTKGTIVTETMKKNAKVGIKNFFKQKGYLNTEVDVRESFDIKSNTIRLIFDVNRNEKVRIQDITFSGNHKITAQKLRAKMKNTRRKRRIFSNSKMIAEDFESDKQAIISYYNTLGFRDASVKSDSVWQHENGDLLIHLDIYEGNPYYFRHIVWKGNSIHDTKKLNEVLDIRKGDIFDTALLETRLRFSEDGRDVSSLYMDKGYLFFQIDPIEVAVVGDSIDIELRIFEGPQAIIDKVTINGNDHTHEEVIRRELRTRPGEKFSRSDIIRSQREIISLGYFNPESLGINTPVNPKRGTVDIEYIVEEKSSDQVELSAGWGGKDQGVIGTLGFSFNNFSIKNILKKATWNPLPQGDGQRLSLRAQTNGKAFQSYNLSFTEPWLGGKTPTALTVAGYYTRQTTEGLVASSDNFGSLSIANFSLSLATRLKFPDDNFVSNTTLNFQTLTLDNWTRTAFEYDDIPVTNGRFHNFNINQTFSRSTINNPIFPTSGSKILLTMQFTPPYSLFANKDYTDKSVVERFKFLEYHKWSFDAEWYTRLMGKLTLKTRIKMGMLGTYNQAIGQSPFERFVLGGDGLSNQSSGLLGYDIISLRGYDIEDLPASEDGGAALFTKYTVELRYPISLNPTATAYVLAFAEGGNAWNTFRDFNPFDVRRSVGLGLRVHVPMFGTLGLDYGLGFDKPLQQGGNGSIFDRFGRLSIILGFEPD